MPDIFLNLLKQRGILLMAIGAICFSAKAIIIKMAYRDYPLDALTLLTLRFGFALPFFAAIVAYQWQQKKVQLLRGRDIAWIAFLSIFGYYIASLFDFKGLEYISAGLERIILFIYPTVVVLLSRIFLGKKISSTGVMALLLTYLGILIIALEPRILEAKNLVIGGVYVLISAITYAIYLTFGGEVINKFGSVTFNGLAMLFSSIYVVIHFFAVSDVDIFHLPAGAYFYGFALAIISTVIPTFLVMKGIRLLGANLGSIVASIGPVSTIVLGYYVLGETFSYQELLGSVLVMSGVILIGLKKDAPTPKVVPFETSAKP